MRDLGVYVCRYAGKYHSGRSLFPMIDSLSTDRLNIISGTAVSELDLCQVRKDQTPTCTFLFHHTLSKPLPNSVM